LLSFKRIDPGNNAFRMSIGFFNLKLTKEKEQTPRHAGARDTSGRGELEQ
jgi:hypothetical protein